MTTRVIDGVNVLSVDNIHNLRLRFISRGWTWENFQAAGENEQRRLAVAMLERLTAEQPDFTQNACINVLQNDDHPVCIVGVMFSVMAGTPMYRYQEDATKSIAELMRRYGSLPAYLAPRLKNLHPDTVLVLSVAQAAADKMLPWHTVMAIVLGLVRGFNYREQQQQQQA